MASIIGRRNLLDTGLVFTWDSMALLIPDYSNYQEEDQGFLDAELLRSNSMNINAYYKPQLDFNTIAITIGLSFRCWNGNSNVLPESEYEHRTTI